MNSLLRAGLLAVLVIAGFSFNASAAAPTANTNLDVNVSVSVPHVMRIMWGTGSTAVDSGDTAVGGTTNAVAWNLGAQDFGTTVLLSTGDNTLTPALPGYTLSIKNAGTAKIDVKVKVVETAGVSDTGTATQKWTLDAAPGVDKYAIKLNALQLTNADVTIMNDSRRADAAFPIDLEFKTPTDSDFTTGDSGIHAFQVKFTATAP